MQVEEWSPVLVDDLIRRGVLALNDGYRVRNIELGPTGIPFVRGGDIGLGDINTNVEDHIRLEFSDRVRSKLTRPFDVAFITKGTVGRVGLMRPGQPVSVFAPQVCYWRSLDTEQLEPRFLFYLLRSSGFQSNLDAVKTHGSMAADYVSLSDQRRFKLTIPPIQSQRSIANILGTLDDKIELNRRMTATLEAMARALFQSWFVDFDPVRRNAEGGESRPEDLLFPDSFEESEMGGIPKGWKVKSLDKIADYQNGLALQKFRPAENEDPLPIVKIAQLKAGEPTWDEVASPSINPACIIDTGDVVFSWSGSLVVTVWTGGRAALNQHLFKVTSQNYPKWFYFHWTQKHLVDFQRIAEDKAVTMGHIKRSHLSEAMCVVPDAKALQEGTRRIALLIEQMIVLETQSRTLAALRNVLLPKLLGKIVEST